MYTYDEITTTLLVIIGAIAVFNMFTAAAKGWKELRKPDVDLREAVEEHDRAIKSEKARGEDHEKRISGLETCCDEVRGKLQNDWEFQRDEKEFNVIMLEAVGQLMKHAMDGNDTDGLKAADEKIDMYLREKSQR